MCRGTPAPRVQLRSRVLPPPSSVAVRPRRLVCKLSRGFPASLTLYFLVLMGTLVGEAAGSTERPGLPVTQERLGTAPALQHRNQTCSCGLFCQGWTAPT